MTTPTIVRIDVVCSVEIADRLRNNLPAEEFNQYSIMVNEPKGNHHAHKNQHRE